MKKIIVYCLLVISLLVALVISFMIDKALYLYPDEYTQTNETPIVLDDIKENVEIKYNWQIAIPKIDVIAPIGEGTDIVTLRNRVGHVSGTGQLSRKYLSSSVIIIQIIIHLGISILIGLMS